MDKIQPVELPVPGQEIWIVFENVFEDRIPVQAMSNEVAVDKVIEYLEKNSPTSLRYSKVKVRYVG